MKKQKPLAIVALSVVVLVSAYFIYDHFRPRCDSIFEQTSTRLGGNLELIKSKGELFVGREKLQELSEGSQKVAAFENLLHSTTKRQHNPRAIPGVPERGERL